MKIDKATGYGYTIFDEGGRLFEEEKRIEQIFLGTSLIVDRRTKKVWYF